MNKFANTIREARLAIGLPTKQVAQALNVDASLISRYESGARLPIRTHVMLLAELLGIDKNELEASWLSQKIIAELHDSNEDVRQMALRIAEEEVVYKTKRPKLPTSLKAILKEIDFLKKELNKYRKFDSYRIAQALELEYTYDSNRIEGNTLTLQETDLVINEGITISGKSMREHLEAINHQDAILFVRELVENKHAVTETNLLRIHNLVLRGIDAANAGKYRNVQVMIKGSQHLPPQPFLVPKEMENLFHWYEANKSRLHPVILAAEMHQRLVTIHPFVDGNGRTSRLLMNLVLLQHGYVIANIKGDNKSRLAYYTTLEGSQVGNSNEAFLQFVLEVERQCMEYYLGIIKVK